MRSKPFFTETVKIIWTELIEQNVKNKVASFGSTPSALMDPNYPVKGFKIHIKLNVDKHLGKNSSTVCVDLHLHFVL